MSVYEDPLIVVVVVVVVGVTDCLESYTVRESYNGRLLISRNVGGNCEFCSVARFRL